MSIPNLKRVKVSDTQELNNWLDKNGTYDQAVMIVTCDRTSRSKYVSSDEVRMALTSRGWSAGRSYTLNGNLVGHVASLA